MLREPWCAGPTRGEETRARESGAAEPGPARERVYLQPGELVVSQTPTQVTTILGSCVAVCLFDTFAGVGGMNHFLLPFRAGSDSASERFGSVAVPRLVERLQGIGAAPARLRAKLFGGSNVTGGFERPDHLGAQNVRLARETLLRLGIRVLAEDVGGLRGRKLIFHTDDGSAWVKLL